MTYCFFSRAGCDDANVELVDPSPKPWMIRVEREEIDDDGAPTGVIKDGRRPSTYTKGP